MRRRVFLWWAHRERAVGSRAGVAGAGPSGVGLEAKRDRGPHQRATAIGAGLNSFCTVLRQVDAVRDKVEGWPAKEDD
jgi:hypothetical protein